jgi:glycosyltransferase involved in cell wall biosynthesis
VKILQVLHQNPDNYPAGIEQYLLDLINGLLLRGVESRLFFPEKHFTVLRHYMLTNPVKEKIYEGGFVDFTELRNKNIEESFSSALHDSGAGVVHFHSMRSLPLSLIEKAKELDKKVIITLHEYFLWCINFILLNPVFCHFEKDEAKCGQCLKAQGFRIKEGFVKERRGYIKRLLSLADVVISPSIYVRDKFIELYPDLDAGKCSILELGIRKELFNFIDLSRRNGSKKSLRVGFLGNFLYHKGSKTFLGLLEQMRDSGDIEFIILGNIYDPIIKEYPNLKIYGNYSRNLISHILREEKIDVTLLLSVIPETFSFTLSESVASGIPVIASDIGALRERVAGYGAGFLVPYENPIPSISDRLRDILANREILEFFNKRCSDASKDIPGIEEMVNAHYDLYSRLDAGLL